MSNKPAQANACACSRYIDMTTLTVTTWRTIAPVTIFLTCSRITPRKCVAIITDVVNSVPIRSKRIDFDTITESTWQSAVYS